MEVDEQPKSAPTKNSTRFVRLFFWLSTLCAVLVTGWFGLQWWEQQGLEQLKIDCREASVRGEWKSLQRLASGWTASAPTSAEAWLNLARAESELGRVKEAAAALGNVPSDDARYPAALLQRAAIEWNELNQPLACVETCRLVLQREPSSIEAYARIIGFYAMTFQRRQMLTAIRESIKARGEPREAYIYLLLADQPIFTNAIDLNARWLASAPDHVEFRVGLAIQTALHRFLTATAEANQDAYANEQEALGRLNEFAKDYPGNTSLLSVLLDYYAEEGDEQKVAGLLSQVSGQSVEDHIIWTARGWYLATQDDLDGAEKSLHNALKLHPCSPRALHEMASVLRAKGQLDEATRMQELSNRGVKLRKRLLQLSNAREATARDLLEISYFARDCGDDLVADTLDFRLSEMPGLSLEKLQERIDSDTDATPSKP